MRLRSRIMIGLLILFMAAGIGLAVAGIPRTIPMDPILDQASVAVTSAPQRPVLTAPSLGSIPETTPGSVTGPSTSQATTTTVNREWLIEILNAGAGAGGASRVADALDLSLIAQVRLADAPNPEERSLIIFRPQASGLMEQLVNANPILDSLERTVVDEWPQWADQRAVIVILVTADWPLDSASLNEER